MNIYAETNFILELVFEQEQYTHCQQILGLCEAGFAHLVIPAYCLVEGHEKLQRQAKERKVLRQNLDRELRELARSASYTARLSSIQEITSLLVQSNEQAQESFAQYRARILTTAEIIPLTLAVLEQAAQAEIPYDLSTQDALVYASVMGHLRQHQPDHSCFINRNAKDFDTPDIVDELAKQNCRMIPRFDQGYQFLVAHLAS